MGLMTEEAKANCNIGTIFTSLFLTIVLGSPKLIGKYYSSQRAQAQTAEFREQKTYRNYFASFVYTAVNSPTPVKMDTPEALSQTCLYLNSADGIPIPNMCIEILRELSACYDSQKPTVRCYEIIGASKDEQ